MKPPLTMLCNVARGGTRDSFGQVGAPSTVATGVPCYWWAGPSRRDQSEAGVTAVEVEHLLVARDADVKQGDRITGVTDHLGRTVFSSSDYRLVEHVVPERSFLDCTLRTGKPIGGLA